MVSEPILPVMVCGQPNGPAGCGCVQLANGDHKHRGLPHGNVPR